MPCPGALAGIVAMKETENVFIETQAAKSAEQNKVPLSGGDRDPALLRWILFCKSRSSVLKHSRPQTASCVDTEDPVRHIIFSIIFACLGFFFMCFSIRLSSLKISSLLFFLFFGRLKVFT